MSELARLLGRPAVTIDGVTTEVRRTKSGALWAFLAYGNRWVDRSELLFLLWPDTVHAQAQANLRQLLRTVGKAPWGRRLELDRRRVRLLVDSDVAEFAAAAGTRPKAALEAYGGRFLDGFHVDDAPEFEAWADIERNALHERWRAVALAAADAALASGAPGEAHDLMQRLLRDDPCDEAAARRAMHASLASGDAPQAHRIYNALAHALYQELASEPSASTRELLGRRGGRTDASPVPVAIDVAEQPSAPERLARRFVGRARELDELVDLIWRPDVRLVSLVAPGGMGKSWLAQALVTRLGSSFADGAAVAHLDDVEGEAGVVHTIAAACRVQLDPAGDPERELLAALANRDALLVLDGFERHQREHRLITAMLARCPRITVLVTSRRRLEHTDEHVVELDGLDVVTQEALGDRSTSDAARLFVRAVGRVAGSATAAALDADRVDELCTAVGGSPLALELCATWLAVAPLADVVERVATSWETLRADDVDRPTRHRDLHDLLQRTWDTMPDDDRRTWSRVAVLRGSFDLDTAVRVAGCGWSGIRRLQRASLVRSRGERLELHALVARFGREAAERSGEAAKALEALAESFSTRLAPDARSKGGAPHELADDDLANLTLAWRHAVTARDSASLARMAIGLQRAFGSAGRPMEIERLCGEAVTMLEGESGAWRDLALARTLLAEAIESDSDAPLERASALADARDDDLARASIHLRRCYTLSVPEGRAHFERSVELFDRLGDDCGVITACSAFASRLTVNGFYDEAPPLLEEARRRAIRVGSQRYHDELDDALASNAFFRGDLDAAEALALSCRARFEARGARHQVANTLQTLAWMARARRDLAGAEALCEAFVALEEEMGRGASLDVSIVRLLTSWSLRRYDEAWRHGRDMLDRFGASAHGPLVTDFTSVWLARVALRCGAPAEARRLLARALRAGLDRERPRLVMDGAVVAAEYAVTRGALDAARSLLRRAAAHPAMDPESRTEAQEVALRIGAAIPERIERDRGAGAGERAAGAAATILFDARAMLVHEQ